MQTPITKKKQQTCSAPLSQHVSREKPVTTVVSYVLLKKKKERKEREYPGLPRGDSSFFFFSLRRCFLIYMQSPSRHNGRKQRNTKYLIAEKREFPQLVMNFPHASNAEEAFKHEVDSIHICTGRKRMLKKNAPQARCRSSFHMSEPCVELAAALAFAARCALHRARFAEAGVVARLCLELDGLLVALHAHPDLRLLRFKVGRRRRRRRRRHENGEEERKKKAAV